MQWYWLNSQDRWELECYAMGRFTVRVRPDLVLDLTDHLPKVKGAVDFSIKTVDKTIEKHFPEHHQEFREKATKKGYLKPVKTEE